jgi:hypothetical protein
LASEILEINFVSQKTSLFRGDFGRLFVGGGLLFLRLLILALLRLLLRGGLLLAKHICETELAYSIAV